MTQEKREKRLIRMADLTHIFHVGQKVRVFVADDIWQKWHKGTVKWLALMERAMKDCSICCIE